jgi:hypothetical protein
MLLPVLFWLFLHCEYSGYSQKVIAPFYAVYPFWDRPVWSKCTFWEKYMFLSKNTYWPEYEGSSVNKFLGRPSASFPLLISVLGKKSRHN